MLLLLTAVFAVLHLTGSVPEDGSVTIDGQTVAIDGLLTENVTGTIVNGKGEETEINARGVCLASLFDGDITVTAADSYSVLVKAEELENAFLVSDGDGLRLAVFGDTDSKRNVKNVAEVTCG